MLIMAARKLMRMERKMTTFRAAYVSFTQQHAFRKTSGKHFIILRRCHTTRQQCSKMRTENCITIVTILQTWAISYYMMLSWSNRIFETGVDQISLKKPHRPLLEILIHDFYMRYKPNRSCVNLNVCGGYGHQYMYMFYLVEGSKLCIPVMKKRTMKAHTRLDLNTSSRIWEYCRGNTHIHTQTEN